MIKSFRDSDELPTKSVDNSVYRMLKALKNNLLDS